MIQIIPEKVRDLQISLKDEQDDHAKTKLRLEDCSKELKELIIESNEKVEELNRDLETLPHEVFGLSHPAELEYRNTIDGLKKELSVTQAENEKLNRYIMQLKTAIDTLIEETVT